MLRSNHDHVAKRLSDLAGIDVEELPEFLKFARALDAKTTVDIVESIDVESASDMWPRVLHDQRREVRKGARATLGLVAELSGGKVRDLAESVLSEHPQQR